MRPDEPDRAPLWDMLTHEEIQFDSPTRFSMSSAAPSVFSLAPSPKRRESGQRAYSN